jgi:hypothetical protein
VRPELDSQLRAAMSLRAPAVPLNAIHQRARTQTVRERLQNSVFAAAAAMAIVLAVAPPPSAYSARVPMASAVPQTLPAPQPAPSPMVS